MEHLRRTAYRFLAPWLLTVLLTLGPAAVADDYLVEYKLTRSDIAEVSIGDPAVIELTASSADKLRSLTTENAGKTLRILFRSVIVQDLEIAEPLETGTITVTAPSDALKDVLECWKKGCPEADDDEGCD